MNIDKHNIIRILKSLGVNYPIIQSIGYGMAKPIVVATAGDGAKAVMECVTNFAAPRIGESDKLRDLAKALAGTNSEFVFLLYSASRKGREQANFLTSTMRLGTKLNALPLMISDGRIRREDVANFFVIYMGENLCDIRVPLEEVIPADEQVEVVLDKINQIAVDGKTPEERALLAAVCFLYPNLRKGNRDIEFGKLVDCVKALVTQDEEGSSTAGLGEMFVTQIYQWQEKTGFCDAYELPFLGMHTVSRIDGVILFDSEFFYMKESLFLEIAMPLLSVFPENVLKSALTEEGIMRPDNAKAYLTKMNFYNIAGNYQRVWMLRFNREMFELNGELDFIELCKNG